MPGRPRHPADWLLHMLEAADEIADFVAGMDRQTLAADRRSRNAVLRSLEVLGEASRQLLNEHPDWAEGHPDLPLRQASGMRNALIHGYFSVDWDIVWQAATVEVPAMRAHLLHLLHLLHEPRP